MGVRGTVRRWSERRGWGVVDSPQTPGGCWTHVSAVAVDGYRSLQAGQEVELEWEAAEQDGFDYRAVRAWPAGSAPARAVQSAPDGAFSSTLTLVFDAVDGLRGTVTDVREGSGAALAPGAGPAGGARAAATAALEAVVRDVGATTGVELRVEEPDDSDPYTPAGFPAPTFRVWTPDGAGTGVFVPTDASDQEVRVHVADVVQEAVVECLWQQGRSTAWPPCPQHPGTHPLSVAPAGPGAVWVCPRSGEQVAAVGALADRPGA